MPLPGLTVGSVDFQASSLCLWRARKGLGSEVAWVAGTEIVRLNLEERWAKGRQARERVPLPGYSRWHPAADFSLRYADQNERDLEDFIKASRSGRLEAVEGV